MKQRRLWPAVVVAALALAGCGSSAGSSKGGSTGSAIGPDHGVGGRGPPAGGPGLRQGPPEPEGQDRHLRRRRQRRDDDADQGPAVEPDRQRLAGRRSSASRSTTRYGWRRSRSSSPRRSRSSSRRALLSQWPAASTAQCTINGTQYCVQDNLAQVVLWVNKKQMDAFGYTVPEDLAGLGRARPEGRQGAPGLHRREHRRLVQPLDLPVGQPVPARAAAGRQAADQLDGLALHPSGQPARPADQGRHAAAAERVHPGLRQEVRRREGQGADDAGTGLVRPGGVRPDAAHPGRRDHRGAPRCSGAARLR